MSVLLVGCGYWGKTLANLGELAAICDPLASTRNALALQYPHAALYADLDDALTHAGLEAVVIATPATSHYELARRCLAAGLSALVEKPLTLHPAESRDLVNFAQQQRLVLAVGHLLSYHPALNQLKTLMAQGVLGDILGVECTRINLGKVRHEENVWWSLAPHDLSIVDMLLDEPIRPVSAHKRNLLRRSTIEDEVYAHFESDSGVPISVRVSWLSPTKRHEVVITGSRKMAIFEDTLPDGQELKLIDYQFEQDGQRFGGIQQGLPELVDYEPAGNLLARQANAFLAAVRGGGQAPLVNSGGCGQRVIELLADVQILLVQQTVSMAEPPLAPVLV
jgi:UDP-2-acetamido-3-amino-2,3-dideoxy-glucuronate N-acetyltransferase